MKRIITLLLFCVVSVFAFAQTGTVSGTLMDGDTGEPVFGATVVVKGTSMGSVTDFDGSFIIKDVDSGSQTVVITFVGYETQEIATEVISGQDANIGNITCNSSAIGLTESYIWDNTHGVGASTTLISLSFYAHYSASIHFLPKLFGTCQLFVILNIQCKFCLIL